MTTAARDLVEAGACAACLEYGDDYDEQPTDITALRASNLKSFGSEDIKANDPGLPTREDWQAIAVATLIATFRKLAEDGPTEAMIERAAKELAAFWNNDWATLAEGPKMMYRNAGKAAIILSNAALARELEGLTP